MQYKDKPLFPVQLHRLDRPYRRKQLKIVNYIVDFLNMYAIAVRYDGKVMGAAIDVDPTDKMRSELFGFENIKLFATAQAADNYVVDQTGGWDRRTFEFDRTFATKDELAEIWNRPILVEARYDDGSWISTICHYWERSERIGSYERHTVVNLQSTRDLETGLTNYARDLHPRVVFIDGVISRAVIIKKARVDRYADARAEEIAFDRSIAVKLIRELRVWEIRAQARALCDADPAFQETEDSMERLAIFRQKLTIVTPQIVEAIDQRLAENNL